MFQKLEGRRGEGWNYSERAPHFRLKEGRHRRPPCNPWRTRPDLEFGLRTLPAIGRQITDGNLLGPGVQLGAGWHCVAEKKTPEPW